MKPMAKKEIKVVAKTTKPKTTKIQKVVKPIERNYPEELLKLEKQLAWYKSFFDNATDSPVLGLRPIRGGRKCSEKLPKPLISILSPEDNA